MARPSHIIRMILNICKDGASEQEILNTMGAHSSSSRIGITKKILKLKREGRLLVKADRSLITYKHEKFKTFYEQLANEKQSKEPQAIEDGSEA